MGYFSVLIRIISNIAGAFFADIEIKIDFYNDVSSSLNVQLKVGDISSKSIIEKLDVGEHCVL